MIKKAQVSLATYAVAEAPDILTSYGIGSCVVVALFDPLLRLAAMAHVMLPGMGNRGKDGGSAKYSDQAIEGMLEELERRGGSRKRLVAKIAGGAQMFSLPPSFPDHSPGQRNVEAITKKLTREGIPLIAKDVGKNFGRSVEFSAESGQMLIKTISEGVREI